MKVSEEKAGESERLKKKTVELKERGKNWKDLMKKRESERLKNKTGESERISGPLEKMKG